MTDVILQAVTCCAGGYCKIYLAKICRSGQVSRPSRQWRKKLSQACTPRGRQSASHSVSGTSQSVRCKKCTQLLLYNLYAAKMDKRLKFVFNRMWSEAAFLIRTPTISIKFSLLRFSWTAHASSTKKSKR